jgi:hypothetical protein
VKLFERELGLLGRRSLLLACPQARIASARKLGAFAP